MGPIKTCNSVTKIYVLHAKTAHENWKKIETSNSGANNAVLCAQNDRCCLGLVDTCYSGPKVSVLHAKSTDEGCDP